MIDWHDDGRHLMLGLIPPSDRLGHGLRSWRDKVAANALGLRLRRVPANRTVAWRAGRLDRSDAGGFVLSDLGFHFHSLSFCRRPRFQTRAAGQLRVERPRKRKRQARRLPHNCPTIRKSAFVRTFNSDADAQHTRNIALNYSFVNMGMKIK
jgi:hypothetical protein